MSNEKLAEALRDATFVAAMLDAICETDGTVDRMRARDAAIRVKAFVEAVQARAAEAAQPQAAEPVATIQLPDPEAGFNEIGPWWDARDLEKLRKLPPGTKLYTHPQPAQDTKDAARYRHMIETSPSMCFGASEYHKKWDLDEAIDNSIAAMAKESGR